MLPDASIRSKRGTEPHPSNPGDQAGGRSAPSDDHVKGVTVADARQTERSFQRASFTAGCSGWPPAALLVGLLRLEFGLADH